MKTIIIGANGYIGTNLSFYLKNHGIENYNYDIHPEPVNDWMKYSKLDVTNKEEFNQIEKDVDCIYFLSGITGTLDSFERYENLFDVNLIGLTHLLDYLVKSGSKAKVVFPSTRLVYKGKDGFLLCEDDPFEAKTPYALSKIAAESMLEMYHNLYDIEYNIFRICVPYGNLLDSNFSYGTIGFLYNQAKTHQKINIFGDGLQKRTFTHVKNICEVFFEALGERVPNNQVFNIGGNQLSLLEAAKIVGVKFDATITHSDWPEKLKKIETGDTVFDDTKLMQYLPDFEYKDLGTFY